MRWSRQIPRSASVVAALVVAAAALAWLWFYSFGYDQPPLEVHYPYWCKDCGAVYDISELKVDYPKNWRRAPGAPSDSVALCIKCNTGWAYPAVPCRKCKRLHVLHLIPDGRCPHCHPEVARQADQAGVNLCPPQLTEYQAP